MAIRTWKPPKVEPLVFVRVRGDDGVTIKAQGRVPASAITGGRQEVLRALQPAPPSDVLGDFLAARQRRERADSLADLQARIERIEAHLGMNKRSPASPLPWDDAPPPAA